MALEALALKERLWRQMLLYFPEHLRSRIENEDGLRTLFDAFYRAATDEMIDKEEITKIMERYSALFNGEI